jgi:hypothetical protein
MAFRADAPGGKPLQDPYSVLAWAAVYVLYPGRRAEYRSVHSARIRGKSRLTENRAARLCDIWSGAAGSGALRGNRADTALCAIAKHEHDRCVEQCSWIMSWSGGRSAVQHIRTSRAAEARRSIVRPRGGISGDLLGHMAGVYEPRRKFGLLLHANWFDPLPLVTEAAGFFAAAWLITRAGIRLPRPWLFAMLLIIPAQIFIAGRQPKPAEMIGAAAGLALFAALERPSGPVRTEAWVFLLVLILSGLAPFKFSSEAKGFDWIPFDTTLTGEWQSAAVTLTKKIFYYGAAVWLLKASGMRLWRSVSIVAAVLAVIEVIQTRLPGRFAEITDPLLAIMIGFVLSKI